MADPQPIQQNDPLLTPYLRADGNSMRELEFLVEEARPLVNAVVRHRLRSHEVDAEEIWAAVRLRILERLRTLKYEANGGIIGDFTAYVSASAANACTDHLRRRQTVSLDSAVAPDGDPIHRCLRDRAPGPDNLASIRSKLEQLWNEILLLKVPQRRSLLLNLPDINLFPVLGVASIRKIAAALEMPAEKLADLWNRLPLQDAEIAEKLGLYNGQKVINLRKCARERLARRLKAVGW